MTPNKELETVKAIKEILKEYGAVHPSGEVRGGAVHQLTSLINSETRKARIEEVKFLRDNFEIEQYGGLFSPTKTVRTPYSEQIEKEVKSLLTVRLEALKEKADQ